MGLITNIGQLLPMPASGGVGETGAIENAAVAWRERRIVFAGPESELPRELADQEAFDAGGRVLIPGLIDCHTHLCFGGWRGDEFAARLEGASYQEIQAAGGGILSTVRATRDTDPETLAARAAEALEGMARLGVTTVEAKSGYGLTTKDEIKQLEVYADLAGRQGVEIVPTFLGAHLVPPEYADNPDAYVDLVCKEIIPRVADRGLARFCDVFIEKGAFTLDQGRRILETARDHGLGLKIHADQLSSGGGAGLAGELGAFSAEHLEYADEAGMKAMSDAGTVAVSLPIASLYLKENYLDAQRWKAAGVRLAVATDFNPGSAPSYHLHMALVLACLNQGMSPAEAVQGATTHAARAIGLQDSHGSLLPGYQADLAIIDAPNINHWIYHFRPNACVGTIKCGEWIHGPEIPGALT